MQYYMPGCAVQMLKISIFVGAALHITNTMLSCTAQMVSL